MATGKAVLPVELVGGQQVEQGISRIEKAFNKVETAFDKIPQSLKTIGSAYATMAGEGLRAAGVLQTISLASGVEETKRLDLATAKLGQSANISGSALKNNFNAIEKKTLTSSVAMAEFSRSLGRATYDGKFAADSVAALGEEALAVGRDLGDELPIAVALRGLGVEAKSLPAELGRIRDMAEQVSTIGGPVALKDTLAALGPELARVSAQTPEARAKLEALVAVLGKGLKPEQAQAVGAAALSTIRSRALDIERVTGKRVLDDNNELIDPTETLKDLKRLADRKYGKKNTEAKRRALMTEFQPDLGLAIYRTDFGEVDKVAASAQDKSKTEAEAERFRQSKEGKRIEAGLTTKQTERGAGDVLLGIHDTLVDNLGTTGALGVELAVGEATKIAGLIGLKAALSGAKTLAGKVLGTVATTAATSAGATAASGATGAAGTASGGLLSTVMGTTAGAVAGFGLAGAAASIPQLALMAQYGEDRGTMGKRYISERAQLLGKDIAAAAVVQGDVNKVIGRAGGDKDIQAATMEALLAKFDQLNATLQGQAQAYAEAMGRKVLKVAMPADPNAPKGN